MFNEAELVIELEEVKGSVHVRLYRQNVFCCSVRSGGSETCFLFYFYCNLKKVPYFNFGLGIRSYYFNINKYPVRPRTSGSFTFNTFSGGKDHLRQFQQRKRSNIGRGPDTILDHWGRTARNNVQNVGSIVHEILNVFDPFEF